MANGEIVKQETTALSLDFGTLSLEGLTPEQQNVIRALVAQKKFDLALKVAEGKIKLDASKAGEPGVSRHPTPRRAGARLFRQGHGLHPPIRGEAMIGRTRNKVKDKTMKLSRLHRVAVICSNCSF